MSIDSENKKRQARVSWLFLGALFILCSVLGALQYRWIGEISVADRERLRVSLQTSLDRISRDFNAEITAACSALVPAMSPDAPPSDEEEREERALRDYSARYAHWKTSTRHTAIFNRIALAFPGETAPVLYNLDLDKGTFAPAEWPSNWRAVRERLEFRGSPEGRWNRRPTPAGPEAELVFELPRFFRGRMPGPPGPFVRREARWIIVELNSRYLRETLLPELLQRHLGTEGLREYQVEVAARRNPREVIYRSGLADGQDIRASADASVGLLELQFEQMIRAMAPPGAPGWGLGTGPGPMPGPEARRMVRLDMGRWQLYLRHKSGSLDAVVSLARWRNLGVTAGILVLMVVTAAALIRFTRNAQNLAELQMNFVAGVSHELRTPLTVIHTAAYNLRGALARNPAQVERYGALIQQESDRLGKLVEQVLRFANTNAGRVIREPEPVSVETVIDDCMESSKADLERAKCVVERNVPPDLPLIMGDPLALKHAIQNLVSNAAKYGLEGGNWIGVSASATRNGEPAVEIRVADRGPGIPEDECEHIFDAFFRGRQALRDQVHGTGLGLNLAKKIVEAHGGTIRVESELLKGTQFTIRIPAAPAEKQDEFTNTASRG